MTKKKQQVKNDTLAKKRIKNESEDSGVAPGGFEDSLYSTLFEVSAGPLFNAALAYGSSFTNLDKFSDLIAELNESVNQSTSFCKGKDLSGKSGSDDVFDENFQEPDPFSGEELKDTAYECLQKSPLYAKSEDLVEDFADDNLGLGTVTKLLSLLDELTRPTDPASCINPYFEQFFNAIPLQFLMSFYIRELLKKVVGLLSQEEIENLVREVEPCGAELTTIVRKDLPDFPDILPLFKLPPVPLIPNVNLHAILRKLLIEAICFGICVTLTPLIRKLTKLMLKLTDGLVESFEDDSTGTISEFLDNSLKKTDLNEKIPDFVLVEAIKQSKIGGLLAAQKAAIGPAPTGTIKNKLGLWKAPSKEEDKKAIASLIVVIRQYFSTIYGYKSEVYKKKQFNTATKKYELVDATRELGTKELIYLMLGEFNCHTMADMIKIGSEQQFRVLKLDTEKRILKFFAFLKEDLNVFQLVDDAKPKDCPAGPCQKIDSSVNQQAQVYLAEICQVLNIDTGVPPIPLNNILNTLGLNKLFNQGIQAQFDQLKTEYQIYLGFPSLAEYPKKEDLNPILPTEHGKNTDYDVWNNKLKPAESFFKKYLMNGGPPLNWKYENIDLSKKLKGQTLADICGADEVFEVTYGHTITDIFGLNMAAIGSKTEAKKKVYAKQYENSIKKMFAVRGADIAVSTDACCKYDKYWPYLNQTPGKSIMGSSDPWETNLPSKLAVVLPANEDPDVVAFVEPLRKAHIDMFNAMKKTSSIQDARAVLGLVKGLPDAEKCFLCRRGAAGGPKNYSFLAMIERYMIKVIDDHGDSESVASIQRINKKEGLYTFYLTDGSLPGSIDCTKYGFALAKGGNQAKAAKDNPSSDIGIAVNKKC